MIRKKLLGTLKFISISDPAIDVDNWDKELQESYFDTDFTLPPILPNETPVIWELRQLSGKELYQVKQLQNQYNNEAGDLHHELVKYIIQHGLTGWSGIVVEDEKGNTEDFEIELVKNGKTKIISDENYFELLSFFSMGTEEALMGIIYAVSRV